MCAPTLKNAILDRITYEVARARTQCTSRERVTIILKRHSVPLVTDACTAKELCQHLLDNKNQAIIYAMISDSLPDALEFERKP